MSEAEVPSGVLDDPQDETDSQEPETTSINYNQNNKLSTSSLFSTPSEGSSEFIPNGGTSRTSFSSTGTAADTNKYLYTGNPPKLSTLERRYKHVMVDPNLQKLPPKCFAKCFGLQHVDLHNQLIEMGEQAFSFCRGLLEMEIPPSLSHLPYQALSGCGRLKHVKLQNGLQSIGMQAFQQCSKLEIIELPPTINSLGNAAFKGCYDLQKVIFPNEEEHGYAGLRVIPAHTFCMCYSLQEMELPSTVEELGDECFSNCVSLQKVTRRLPPSNSGYKTPMKVIGHGCFLQCMALVELANFELRPDDEGSGRTSMGEMAFEGCSQFNSLQKEVPPTTKMSNHSRRSIRNSLRAISKETAASIRGEINPLGPAVEEEEEEEEEDI